MKTPKLKVNIHRFIHSTGIIIIDYKQSDLILGARYRMIEKEVRGQLLEEMEAEEERQRKLLEGDDETRYTSEAKEKFNVPGFVHRVPEPKVVCNYMKDMILFSRIVFEYIFFLNEFFRNMISIRKCRCPIGLRIERKFT